jgi:hypothetical protein
VQVRDYVKCLQSAFGGLMETAAAVARELERSGSQAAGRDASSTLAGMPQALRLLTRQLLDVLHRVGAASLVQAVTLLQQQVLPKAEALAQLLWQYWQQPEQQAAARLELAQAAATRCCAYLRCSQLGAQGGPAAGEGVGSKRCSGCRVTWYCGTACSHADWRAGHSKVCKALAAAQGHQQG